MKKIVNHYTFDASAQTVTCEDFNNLNKIALITNVTDNIIIYNFADPAKGGTLSGDVLTLDYDTTTMSDTDVLQIILHTGTDLDRIGFVKAISNGVDTDFFNLSQTGSGQTVNQTGGNLVITTGTTARAETIIRSNNAYVGGMRFKIQTQLSQRIANQQFFAELVDVIGDSLAYTINSATSITVTLPASFGLSTQNIGQSMTLQGFSGTGTFLSGRYPISSVSGNDATFTVSGFAVGTGTVSAVGWSFYRLEYINTIATNVNLDVGRKGYSSGSTATLINTTASSGHMAILTADDGVATFQDQVVASTAVIQTINRASRVVMVPDDIQLFLQIRVVNGSTAPASTTTWTIGQVSVEEFTSEGVVVQDIRPTTYTTALPVDIARSVNLTALVANATLTTGTVTAAPPTLVADVASAAITTTTTTAAITPTTGSSYQVNIPVTVVSGTSPTLTVAIEESSDNGTNWFNRFTFPVINATGIYYSPILKLRGTRVRYVQTITGTTPSFTRAINREQRQDTSFAGTPGKLVSAATTNATSVRTTQCELLSLTVTNTNASARYLKIYDKATAPTVGTDTPVQTFLIPGNATGSGSNIPLAAPINFNLGFAFALTTGATDADTGAVAANEIIVNYSIN